MKWNCSLLVLSAAAILTGCAGQTSRSTPFVVFTDMDRQGRFDPQGQTQIFSDHRMSRRPPVGTVARGMLKEDDVFVTGVIDNQYVGKNPLTIDSDVMAEGQRRFNTYCSPCHDRTGQGRGLVGVRAVWIPTNLHEDRVKAFNDGEIYHVITNGRRSMPPYKFQVTERDRWAIVAYVRALQRTTSGTVDDVPQQLRAELR